MQVHDALPDAPGSAVDSGVLFALPPGEPVQAKQVAIFGLHDVLFSRVSKDGAEIDKVGGISDFGRDGWRRDGCQLGTAMFGRKTHTLFSSRPSFQPDWLAC